MPSNPPTKLDTLIGLLGKLLGQPLQPTPVLVPVTIRRQQPTRVRVEHR